MEKPTKVKVEHYVYLDVIKYIEKKYNINTKDYYRKWKNKSDKYANFWHWFIYINDNISNGCYAYFPEDLPWGEVKEDPKCYNDGDTPEFVMEIMDLIVKEFGEEILGEKIWVEW